MKIKLYASELIRWLFQYCTELMLFTDCIHLSTKEIYMVLSGTKIHYKGLYSQLHGSTLVCFFYIMSWEEFTGVRMLSK